MILVRTSCSSLQDNILPRRLSSRCFANLLLTLRYLSYLWMARASMFRDFLPYLNLFWDFYRFWLFCCDRLTEIFYLAISRPRENPYSKFASLKITVANLKSIKAVPNFLLYLPGFSKLGWAAFTFPVHNLNLSLASSFISQVEQNGLGQLVIV